ncbi:DUF5324 family protein [Streptomyces venezuelae]|uniref:DUF5324 family protein n=1 Tax=Streptomyces venezuelae TaxID=54571 RepID=UPI001CC247CC|nr:DUF5324 family protein [Streptomyces venezuelae]
MTTRKDSVRAVAESAKDTVRHAAEVVAPYAESAREAATHYAHEANVRLTPMMSSAAHETARQARSVYDTHLHPRMQQARTHVPPPVDRAATTAVLNTRKAARQAADYTTPKIEHAMAAAQPVAEEAASRSTAAFAALSGKVSAKDVRRLVRRRERREKCGRAVKGVALVGLLAGVAFVAWKWWDRQSNPDWLVEPPAATELSARDSEPPNLDDELQAKEAAEAEAEADEKR